MTTELTVVYWRDIPAQVMAGKGRTAVRRALPDRFQDAIDRAATRAGLIGSDEYTSEWRKEPTTGPIEDVAGRLEANHPQEVLEAMVRNGGRR